MARLHPIRTTILGLLVLAATISAPFILGSRTKQNSEEIQQRPTKAEVYRALVEARRTSRRACQVVNRRFEALAQLVATQRPSPTTTAYYADHPGELARAQAYFDETVRVLQPRNCLRDYPPPDPRKFGLPSRLPEQRRRPSPHKGSSSRSSSSPATPHATRPTPQATINPPRQHAPTRTFPTSRPRRPGSPQPAPTQPSPNLPVQPGVTPPTPPQPAGPPQPVRDRLCADPHLAGILPFC